MVRDALSVLSPFIIVAEERSFTRGDAAEYVNVRPHLLACASTGCDGRAMERGNGTHAEAAPAASMDQSPLRRHDGAARQGRSSR